MCPEFQLGMALFIRLLTLPVPICINLAISCLHESYQYFSRIFHGSISEYSIHVLWNSVQNLSVHFILTVRNSASRLRSVPPLAHQLLATNFYNDASWTCPLMTTGVVPLQVIKRDWSETWCTVMCVYCEKRPKNLWYNKSGMILYLPPPL